MFLTLQNWRDPERITALAGIAAFARRETDAGELLKIQGQYLQERFGARVAVVELPHIIDLSSTQVRALLDTDRAQVRDALWCQVYGYILRNGLYGVEADLKHLDDDDLRCASLSMVKAKRLPHIQGTEETAAALAAFWGVSPEKARRAAILHDCTKYWTLEQHLETCAKYGVELDELECVSVKLLHSKSAAALARHVFAEPEEECRAISAHTTGKPGMTTFDKILYLADYMEPTRDFDGVEELRRLVWEDLDRAMILGLEMSIEDLKEKGATVHPNTWGTLEELRRKTR